MRTDGSLLMLCIFAGADSVPGVYVSYSQFANRLLALRSKSMAGKSIVASSPLVASMVVYCPIKCRKMSFYTGPLPRFRAILICSTVFAWKSENVVSSGMFLTVSRLW
jgi:hypothetical protein